MPRSGLCRVLATYPPEDPAIPKKESKVRVEPLGIIRLSRFVIITSRERRRQMKPCGRTRAVSTDSTEGPLGRYIPGFGELLSNQGYARSTAREKIRLITNLDHWLQRRSIDGSTLDEKHAMRVLSQRQIWHPSRRGDPATVRAL